MAHDGPPTERPEPLAPPGDGRRDDARNTPPMDELMLVLIETAGPIVVLDGLIEQREKSLTALRALRLLVPDKCHGRAEAEAFVTQIRAIRG